MSLRLGLIGFSDGNAHPYSWSAICNGYSVSDMENCGFPVIPQYLGSETWPAAKIPNVKVTHLWTQKKALSRHIAKACYIPHVVDDPLEMIGQIDGLLLARDDAENHLKFVQPFLDSGVPVYIDKPIATSIQSLNVLYDMQKYEGQIFTCSALRYASELNVSIEDRQKLGPIDSIEAITPKSWEKYAVHIIEPVLNILNTNDPILESHSKIIEDDGVNLAVKYQSGVNVSFTAAGPLASGPISIRLNGNLGSKEYIFQSAFSAFKSAINDFLLGIESRTCRSPRAFNERVVSLIELGLSK
jgi:hypothetical protein